MSRLTPHGHGHTADDITAQCQDSRPAPRNRDSSIRSLVHQAPVIMGIMLFLGAAPIYDFLARRRLSRVSLSAGLAVLVSLPLRFAVAQTAAWHALANWLVR